MSTIYPEMEINILFLGLNRAILKIYSALAKTRMNYC